MDEIPTSTLVLILLTFVATLIWWPENLDWWMALADGDIPLP